MSSSFGCASNSTSQQITQWSSMFYKNRQDWNIRFNGGSPCVGSPCVGSPSVVCSAVGCSSVGFAPENDRMRVVRSPLDCVCIVGILGMRRSHQVRPRPTHQSAWRIGRVGSLSSVSCALSFPTLSYHRPSMVYPCLWPCIGTRPGAIFSSTRLCLERSSASGLSSSNSEDRMSSLFTHQKNFTIYRLYIVYSFIYRLFAVSELKMYWVEIALFFGEASHLFSGVQ